jgi:uncharacterized protein with gpF-like domain
MSNYFNLGKFAIEKGPKIVKTAVAPITHSANVIKSFFKGKPKETAKKYKKKALKMIKDATAKAGKSAKEAESRIGKEEAQKIGRETKSKMMKDYLRYNRDLKAKGGPVDKKKKNKKFPDLTGDGKVTFADVLKGRGVINGKKKKKKVI